jgi:alkylation response protein AidB-like acyl-CoA dehydrogenase
MRFGGGCVLLGIVAGALADVLPWLDARVVLPGEPLAQKSHVQLLLGDLFGELHALRVLLLRAAGMLDAGRRCTLDTSLLKLRTSRLAERAAGEIVQLYGWRGVDADYPAQKRLRDARVSTIYEGSSEVQLLSLYAELRRQVG